MPEFEIAAKLSELTRISALETGKIKTGEAFLELRDNIWPLLMRLQTPLPKYLYTQASAFLGSFMIRLFQRGYTGRGCNLAVAEMIAYLGKKDLTWRTGFVLNVCYPLMMETKPHRRYELFREVIDLWKHMSQLNRDSQKGKELQFALPSPEELRYDIERHSNSKTLNSDPTTNALAALFVQSSLRQSRMLVPALITTVAFLSDPKTPRDLVSEAAPLLRLITMVLKIVPITNFRDYMEVDYCRLITRFPTSKVRRLKDYVIENWPRAEAMLLTHDETFKELAETQRRKLVPQRRQNLSSFHVQLRQAYKSDNIGAIFSIWADLKAQFEKDKRLGNEMRNDDQFLDFWHFIWCALGRPAMLQEVQDFMKQVGVSPTVRTYTAMMHGWKTSQSIGEIESLWEMLSHSDIKLDLHIWVERVSALVELGRHQAGIEAMAEMLALWKKANEQKRPETAVQPDIEVINAALPGLLAHDRAAANAVLDWAGQEGMKPDVTTYNILLKETLRNNDQDSETEARVGTARPAESGVMQLFQSMKAASIEPDAATFAIMLEEALGGLQGTTAGQQVEAVDHVFQDIHDAGLQPNQEIFGKLLYAVASLPQSADDAIEAVQDRMRRAGWHITPHMVTTLLDRLMARDPPPSGAAITALLEKHRCTTMAKGDQPLWERAISAYSVAGDVPRAWALYEDMRAIGRAPLQRFANADLVFALINAGKVDEARQVVQLVLKKTDPNVEGRQLKDGDRYWRHRLWHLAHAHGLLDPDTVPLELKKVLNSPQY